MAEAVIATVVLGIAAAGVLLPFTSGVSVRAEGAHRTLGAKLASDLMEEIIKTPFEQIKTTYEAYTEQVQVKDASGAVFTDSNYTNFSRTATCEPWHGSDYFILVTVKVYYSGKQIAIINRLISK